MAKDNTPPRRPAESSRRGILRLGASVASLTGLSAIPHFAMANQPPTAIGWPAGIQLWMVARELDQDLPGTLERIKRLGYDVVETAGTHGKTAKAFRSLVDGAGLKARSAHAGMPALIDNLDLEIASAIELGIEWLICSAPKPPVAPPPGLDWATGMTQVMTGDAWKANAEAAAAIAPRVKAAGLKFGYHNHLMEFKRFPTQQGDELSGMDVLLSAGDPTMIRVELDIGWLVRAGQDPIATMQKYRDRLDLLHIKDVVRDRSLPTGYRSTDLGTGLIDYRPIFEAAKDWGVKQYFLEQDPPFASSAVASLGADRQYLAALGL